MYNKPTQIESVDLQSDDCASADLKCLAYGRQVKELLSASSADTWCDHLWEIYDGYMLAQPDLGYNPRSADIYWSFKDLLFFFEGLKKQ